MSEKLSEYVIIIYDYACGHSISKKSKRGVQNEPDFYRYGVTKDCEDCSKTYSPRKVEYNRHGFPVRFE
jgi:hypothetical protein